MLILLLAFLLLWAVLLSSFLLLVASITDVCCVNVVGFVPAVACFPVVAGILAIAGAPVIGRVRRSFSLKAKRSENQPIFFRFEAKKIGFFRLFSL